MFRQLSRWNAIRFHKCDARCFCTLWGHRKKSMCRFLYTWKVRCHYLRIWNICLPHKAIYCWLARLNWFLEPHLMLNSIRSAHFQVVVSCLVWCKKKIIYAQIGQNIVIKESWKKTSLPNSTQHFLFRISLQCKRWENFVPISKCAVHSAKEN